MGTKEVLHSQLHCIHEFFPHLQTLNLSKSLSGKGIKIHSKLLECHNLLDLSVSFIFYLHFTLLHGIEKTSSQKSAASSFTWMLHGWRLDFEAHLQKKWKNEIGSLLNLLVHIWKNWPKPSRASELFCHFSKMIDIDKCWRVISLLLPQIKSRKSGGKMERKSFA